MLRQYQTAARGIGGSALSGGADSGWTLKDSHDVIPSSQVRPMSSKILAVGVMLAGVLVLSVALIMGLEFPKYVYSQFRDDQCVVHGHHEKISSWSDGSQWRREVWLYYQHLLNPDHFLYHGAYPQFEERGPYVYEEYETREDAKFSVTEVTYRVSRRHVYSAKKTAQACPTCLENDTVTVVNTDFLRKMYETGGFTNYLLSIMPTTLTQLLQHQGLYTPHTFPPNISLLGCLEPVCDNSLSGIAAKVSFGRWLRTTNTGYSSLLLNDRNRLSFRSSETGGIYKALLNSSVLGSDVFKSTSASKTDCQTWASYLCKGQQLPVSLSLLNPSNTCGLFHILQSCDLNSALPSEAREEFITAFCVSSGDAWCLDLNSTSPQVLSAYFHAFHDYILLYLPRVIYDYVIAQTNRDLVVTRPQTDLALGYYVTSVVDQSAVHVPGLLDEYWLKTPTSEGSEWKVYTCLEARNMNNNMKVREFGGSQYAPQGLMRHDGYSVRFSGQTDFFSACSPVSCYACASPGSSVYLFLPMVQRTFRFTTDGVPMSLWGTDVYRYWLSQDAFAWSDHYKVSCGLQQITSSLGFVGWISLPKLNASHLQSVGKDLQNCSLPEPQSFMDIEPITGRLWQRRTQFQLNAGIRRVDVTGPRWPPLNVSYLSKAVPIVWTERRLTLSDVELSYYDYKVKRLLRVSCGGLIGLSIVAVIVVGVGFVIFIYPKKTNRITPSQESDSAANLHSRHFNS